MVTAEEILATLSDEFVLKPDDPARARARPGGGVPGRWRPARVGVIGSVTRPFCGACDRVRLTADGQVRNCLFAREESDLRGPLRAGASDAELAALWRRAVAAKLPGRASTTPRSCSPTGPCRPSAGERRPGVAPGGAERQGTRATTAPFGIIILAGGRATRLGGADKPGLVVGGRTLLAAVVAAGTEAGARRVVVVGPDRPGITDGAAGPQRSVSCARNRPGPGRCRPCAAGSPNSPPAAG